MIQPETVLNVADNSGAKKMLCIRVLNKSRKQTATVGDVILGVVKTVSPNMALKKSDKVRAVVVRTKKAVRRSNGSSVCFQDNAAIVINRDNNPRGSRVFGPVARELRSGFAKIVSLAIEVL